MENTAMVYIPVLELLEQPALLARDGAILFSNPAAAQLGLLKGGDLSALISDASADGVSFDLTLKEQSFTLIQKQLEDCTLILLKPLSARDQIALSDLSRMTNALRVPLSNLLSGTQALFPYLEEQEDSFIQTQAAMISRACYRLIRATALIGDECALSGSEAKLHLRKTELCSFFAKIGELAASFCAECGVTLRTEVPNRLFTADIDRQKLERACYNLISNALRHTKSGGEILFRLEQSGPQATILVKDTGSGIDAQTLQLISDHGAAASPDGGVGFGLQYARSVAELHGGGLMLLSSPGEGTTVRLSFHLTNDKASPVVGSPTEIYDYAGGLDHAHLELSDVMPDHVYDSRNI